MQRVSRSTAPVATQQPRAIRNDRLANLAGNVDRKVAGIRRLLVNAAPKGLGAQLATTMGWRPERRSRELSGVEKLSLAALVAEIEIHAIDGRQDTVDEIVAALLDGIRTTSIPVTSGSVFRVFDKNGQLFLRLGGTE